MTVLAITVITSYGVLYYAFAALSPSIVASTGWSSVEVTGAFSISQLVATHPPGVAISPFHARTKWAAPSLRAESLMSAAVTYRNVGLGTPSSAKR